MSNIVSAAAMSVSGTPGTGTVTLGAAKASYLSFADAGCVNGQAYSYVLKDGNSREGGTGTYNSAGSFSRDVIEFSTAGGTTPINATSSATIFITPLSWDFNINARSVDSVSDFQNTFVPCTVQTIYIRGYRTIGQGGLWVRRVDSAPLHPWQFRTLDRFTSSGTNTTSSTNGGYWEGFQDTGFITPDQFGAYANNSNDDLPSIMDCIHYCQLQLRNASSGLGQKLVAEIFFPSMTYYCSDTISIGVSPGNYSEPVTLRGRTKMWQNERSTTIRFPVDKTGIHTTVYSFGPTHIKGLALVGVNGTGTAHGIHMNAVTHIEDCIIEHFSTHGIYGESGSGQIVDSVYASRVLIQFTGRDGINMSGTDSQIGLFELCSMREIGGCGICDSSSFGNLYNMCQIAGNGMATYQTRGTYGAVVQASNGKNYMVASVAAEASTASTDPAGTSDNSIWIDLGTTGPGYPAYVAGRTYNYGPCIYTGSLAVFNDIYVEVNFSPPSINAGGGGVLIQDMTDFAPMSNGGGCQISGYNGGIKIRGGLIVTSQVPSRAANFANTIMSFEFGGIGTDVSNGLLMRYSDTILTTPWAWQLDWNNKNIIMNFGGTYEKYLCDINTPLSLKAYGNSSGPNTLVQFHMFNGFLLGNRNGTAMQMFSAGSAPTSVIGSGGPGDARPSDMAVMLANYRVEPLGWRFVYDAVAAAWGWQALQATEVSIYKPCTVAQLASLSPKEGDRGSVTDAVETFSNIGSAPTGSGSNKLPVIYLNGGWLIA